MSMTPRPWPERFWRKVAKGDGCWLWTASRHNHGYGVIEVGGRGGSQRYAHRVAWELAYGPIPAGMQVLHRCDNPPCVNPAHLFLGTPADNMADMVAKGRAAKPEVTKHVGVANGRAVIDSDAVRAIRTRHRAGETMAAIARSFGIGETTVRNVLTGYRWGHVA